MSNDDERLEGYDIRISSNLELKKARYKTLIQELYETKMSIDEFIELKRKANNLAIQIETESNILNGTFANTIQTYSLIDFNSNKL